MRLLASLAVRWWAMDIEPVLNELTELVDAAATTEGMTRTAIPGLFVHRLTRRGTFEKWRTFGPSVSVVVKGRKVSSYRGQELSYDRSNYLVVTGEADFIGNVVEAEPFLAFCYQIPAEIVAETLLALADAAPPAREEAIPAFVVPIDAAIAECSLRLLRAEHDPLERKLVAPLVIREIVFRLLRSDAAAALRSTVGRDEESVKIGTAMRFIRDNIGSPLAVEDIARHVAMSPSHFAHRFRAVARMSPMRYVRQLRLQHARRWMIADGLRVNEAASRAGYESTSHFTRDFKSEYGAAPGEYTKRFRLAETRIAELGTSPAGHDVAGYRAQA